MQAPRLPSKAREKNANSGLCLLALPRQPLSDLKYQSMPGLYFLSTGAEISNIANLKKFGFQQGLDVLEPDFAQVWGKRAQESKRYFNNREGRAKDQSQRCTTKAMWWTENRNSLLEDLEEIICY